MAKKLFVEWPGGQRVLSPPYICTSTLYKNIISTITSWPMMRKCSPGANWCFYVSSAFEMRCVQAACLENTETGRFMTWAFHLIGSFEVFHMFHDEKEKNAGWRGKRSFLQKHIIHQSINQIEHYYIHMSYGRNYLFGEYAFTKCGGSPIGYQGFGCSGHQHQNRSMRFTVWDDLICYMIENCRRASQDARVPFDSKCRYKCEIFECALVHLGYTYYRHLWKHEKEGSTFFGSQQGQQTMNFELWSKPFLPQSGM